MLRWFDYMKEDQLVKRIMESDVRFRGRPRRDRWCEKNIEGKRNVCGPRKDDSGEWMINDEALMTVEGSSRASGVIRSGAREERGYVV